jgi:hypothetical protein
VSCQTPNAQIASLPNETTLSILYAVAFINNDQAPAHFVEIFTVSDEKNSAKNYSKTDSSPV